jgi:hypothetical protein
MNANVKQFFEAKMDPHKIKVICKYKKYTVWLVNGLLVRKDYFVDFTEGGNGARYKFVPKNEIWIDDDLSEDEWPYVIEHEIMEKWYMDKGYPYEKAHAIVAEVEIHERQNPEESLKALKTKFGL